MDNDNNINTVGTNSIFDYVDFFKELILQGYSDKVNEDIYPCYDGPCCEYFDSSNPLKILWLLKEAYDGDEDNASADWSLTGALCSKPDDMIVRLHCRRTWQPVVYASHGILNGFILWDDMPYIRNDKMRMLPTINKIAVLNISKLLARGTSPNKHVAGLYVKYGAVVHKQIETLNPDVIICANTFQFAGKDLIADGLYQQYNDHGLSSYESNNRVIVAGYHPAARMKNTIKVDAVIQSVRDWYYRNKVGSQVV